MTVLSHKSHSDILGITDFNIPFLEDSIQPKIERNKGNYTITLSLCHILFLSLSSSNLQVEIGKNMGTRDL
jgi:hypothetical protein